LAPRLLKYGFSPIHLVTSTWLSLPKVEQVASAAIELLLILLYASFCFVVFKLFRIPVNQWSLATAVLGGIVGIALLLLGVNYNHPFSNNARIYFSVTPVYAGVRGRVIDVPGLCQGVRHAGRLASRDVCGAFFV